MDISSILSTLITIIRTILSKEFMESTSILITLITTIIGTVLPNGYFAYYFNKKLKSIEKENALQLKSIEKETALQLKSVEKENLWRTKLLDDIYNAHKSLWEDLREYTIQHYFSYRRENEDVANSTYIMYFLRSSTSTKDLIIKFRDNLAKYSIFLEKKISNDAEYLQIYMDEFQRLLLIKSINIEQKELINYEWILTAKEFSKLFEIDVLPTIKNLQILTENYLRKNILEHEWIDVTDSERQNKDNLIQSKLELTLLYRKINDEPMFLK